jgi:hypothetical protein
MIDDLADLWTSAAPAKRKAALYGLLAAGGWAFDSEAVMAVGLGGLVGALVELWSNVPRRQHVQVVGQDSEEADRIRRGRGGAAPALA